MPTNCRHAAAFLGAKKFFTSVGIRGIAGHRSDSSSFKLILYIGDGALVRVEIGNEDLLTAAFCFGFGNEDLLTGALCFGFGNAFGLSNARARR